MTPDHAEKLAENIKNWARELGFDKAGITDINLQEAEQHLQNWLKKGFHGDMDYMQRHGLKRSRPDLLVPGTIRVISLRMNYRPAEALPPDELLQKPARAFISRYALGRDYHKVLRQRLQKLTQRINDNIDAQQPGQYRVFVDSAPVLEKALAEKAGLGWIGKHSNLLDRDAGSWFFLGEIYTNLPLPIDQPVTSHCGECRACIDLCPTRAIVAPYQVDARRCISYLTIENHGAIAIEFRKAIGNRIYGCDDCQLVCPWNRFAKDSHETDFLPRHNLDSATLVELFSWDEETFLKNTEGSAIRRIGYQKWNRNLAVALGNIPTSDPASTAAVNLLKRKLAQNPSALLQEHFEWALQQLNQP